MSERETDRKRETDRQKERDRQTERERETERHSQGRSLTGKEFEIVRAHLSLAPLPNPNKPPRTIMTRFLRSSAQDNVLQAAKEKRCIEWEGCKLSFFEDLMRVCGEKKGVYPDEKMPARDESKAQTDISCNTYHYIERTKEDIQRQ